MNIIAGNNMKSVYVELISVYEYIQLKSKIKTLDIHQNLPWIVFSDLENNVMIYDVIEKKPIRAFNMQQFFNEQVSIKDLKFFHINDKQYVMNYDLNEIKKIKGIPFQLRSNLLIITLDKHICFYSCVTQNFIKTIMPPDLEQKQPVKCEIFNYIFIIIQTSDGSLIIWNILDWTLVKVINKTTLGKPVSNFIVITTKKEEKFIVVANTNGNLFLIDISKKDVNLIKLDEKTEHDANVLYMDYNPNNNILSSISKNAIYLVDIRNLKINKRLPNFQYHKSEKAYGVIGNLNNNFTRNTYFIYGKTSVISSLDLTIEHLNRKIETKDMKQLLSYNFDLELQNLPKGIDRAFKIYIAKFLNHTYDYMVLGTNKGVVIARFNIFSKSEIIPCTKLIDLNEDKLFFYSIYNSGLLEQSCNKEGSSYSFDKMKCSAIVNQVFDNKSMTTGCFNRFKISFSYDGMFMSAMDITNNIYTIYQLAINEDLKYSCKPIKYGKCAGELEWCPYDLIFAVTTASFSQVSTKSSTSNDKNRLTNSFKISFSLTVFKISDGNVNTLYIIDDLPCHRLFVGHYIGVLVNFINTNESNQEDLTFPGTFSNFTYQPNNQLVLNFYQWTEKIKMDIYLSEEPKFVLSSSDLSYMVIAFVDKYILYSISLDSEKSFSLSPLNIFYYKLVDAFIYENFILIFLTDKGVYFHILTEDNAYPCKLLKHSDEMNMFHLKISKKIKEKNPLYGKKLLPHKIIGVFYNNLVLSSSFNNISISSIDNILFKIVHLIVTRRFNEIPSLLILVEKKYVKSILAIFKYYFNNNEEIIRKIFMAHNAELVDHFQLYKYEDYFLQDYLSNPLLNVEDRAKVDKTLKSYLVKNINNNNVNGINMLYEHANKNGLTFEILCSKYIDPNSFLKSMLLHNRNFESYVFNENHKINKEMSDKILSRAYERINIQK